MSVSDRRLDELSERAELGDAAIDFSDIPELDEAFFRTAVEVRPEDGESITLRLKTSVVDAYRRLGGDATARMTTILEAYAKAKLG